MNTFKRTKPLFSLSILMILSIFILPASRSITGYGVGDYASDFSLPDFNGKMISMSDFKDAKGMIVVFTCNTCPYAKAYESRILDLNNKYAEKGFPVIAINPNDVSQKPGDSKVEMEKRAKKKGYTFPYLIDESQEVAKAFGATKTPHTFVLDKENDKFRVAYIGAIDDSSNDPSDVSETYVEDAVEALLMGSKPKTTEKKL